MRLKKMGLTADLLFPNEDVPLSRVLGNIASRGCLYAVVVTPINMEHRSLTLNILHGLPQGKIQMTDVPCASTRFLLIGCTLIIFRASQHAGRGRYKSDGS